MQLQSAEVIISGHFIIVKKLKFLEICVINFCNEILRKALFLESHRIS